MNGERFSTAECEAFFGPECTERVERAATEAPRFTPEQILRGKALFASFCVPQRPTDTTAEAA